MEKEKKGIRCSYAVLVIILFAALAFVTDYAVIERKTSERSVSKLYNQSELAGHYTARYDSLDDGFGNVVNSVYNLYLYEDGTFCYTRSLHSITGKLGAYTIDGNVITLSVLFDYGSDMGMGVSFNTIKVSFDGNYQVYLESSDGIENQEIVLSRVEKYDKTNNEDSLVKQRLDSSDIYNSYTNNN